RSGIPDQEYDAAGERGRPASVASPVSHLINCSIYRSGFVTGTWAVHLRAVWLTCRRRVPRILEVSPPVLGAMLAALSAASFGLNNAMARRGVLTGSVVQALAIGTPIGALMFSLFALLSGGIGVIATFPRDATLIASAAGMVH